MESDSEDSTAGLPSDVEEDEQRQDDARRGIVRVPPPNRELVDAAFAFANYVQNGPDRNDAAAQAAFNRYLPHLAHYGPLYRSQDVQPPPVYAPPLQHFDPQHQVQLQMPPQMMQQMPPQMAHQMHPQYPPHFQHQDQQMLQPYVRGQFEQGQLVPGGIVGIPAWDQNADNDLRMSNIMQLELLQVYYQRDIGPPPQRQRDLAHILPEELPQPLRVPANFMEVVYERMEMTTWFPLFPNALPGQLNPQDAQSLALGLHPEAFAELFHNRGEIFYQLILIIGELRARAEARLNNWNGVAEEEAGPANEHGVVVRADDNYGVGLVVDPENLDGADNGPGVAEEAGPAAADGVVVRADHDHVFGLVVDPENLEEVDNRPGVAEEAGPAAADGVVVRADHDYGFGLVVEAGRGGDQEPEGDGQGAVVKNAGPAQDNHENAAGAAVEVVALRRSTRKRRAVVPFE